MLSLDVRVLLGADVGDVEALQMRAFELVELMRKRWIANRTFETIANAPISKQRFEFYPEERGASARVAVPEFDSPREIGDARCCLVAVDRALCPAGVQRFWGFTRHGAWILFEIYFDIVRKDGERFIVVKGASVVGNHEEFIKSHCVTHSLQMLNQMYLMVWRYHKRMERIVCDINEERERLNYEVEVAQDRARALGWDVKKHGAMK